MVSIELNKILEKTTLKVLKEIAMCDSTYREKKKILGIDLSAIYYHVNKLINFGLIEKTSNGKLKNLVKCPYCKKTNICKGSYPEGCFLDHELTPKTDQ